MCIVFGAGINHFNEWLQQVQAKETFDISDDVMQQVMQELRRQRVTDMASITPKKVREVLKTLKLRKVRLSFFPHILSFVSFVRVCGERGTGVLTRRTFFCPSAGV